MQIQSNTGRTTRAARPGAEARQAKAESLAARLAKALKQLTEHPPVSARTSAAYETIRPKADTILALLQRGISAHAIARHLADEDGPQSNFSSETIRCAIKRLEAEAKVSGSTKPSSLSAAAMEMDADALGTQPQAPPSYARPAYQFDATEEIEP